MSRFPAWDRPAAVWSNATQLRQAQIRRVLSELAALGEEATSEVGTKVVAHAERTLRRCEQLPRAMVGELRRRVNVLDLATRQDVEVQSKLGRRRLSVVVKELREAQRVRDEELLHLLRSELQEELATFASAIADDLFAMDGPERLDPRGQRGGRDDGAGDDDESDLVAYDEYDEARFSDDDSIDLAGNGIGMRRAQFDPTEG
jgi:hypothetical protein